MGVSHICINLTLELLLKCIMFLVLIIHWSSSTILAVKLKSFCLIKRKNEKLSSLTAIWYVAYYVFRGHLWESIVVYYITHHISISVQHLSSYWTWTASLYSTRSITSGKLLQLPERFLTSACQQALQTLFQEHNTEWRTTKCLTRFYIILLSKTDPYHQ